MCKQTESPALLSMQIRALPWWNSYLYFPLNSSHSFWPGNCIAFLLQNSCYTTAVAGLYICAFSSQIWEELVTSKETIAFKLRKPTKVKEIRNFLVIFRCKALGKDVVGVWSPFHWLESNMDISISIFPKWKFRTINGVCTCFGPNLGKSLYFPRSWSDMNEHCLEHRLISLMIPLEFWKTLQFFFDKLSE